MKNMQYSSVRVKLWFIILTSSTIITTVLTIASFLMDLKKDKATFHASIQQVKLTTLESVASALYKFDKSLVDSTVNGIVQLPEIKSAIVYDDSNQIYSEAVQQINVQKQNSSIFFQYIWNLTPETTSEFRLPLFYSENDKKSQIGELYFIASERLLYATLYYKTFFILLTNALKTFLVSIIIFLITDLLVTKHLKHISQFLKQYDFKNIDKNRINLNTKKIKKSPDEIDLLYHTLSTLLENLASFHQTQNETIGTQGALIKKQQQEAQTAARLAGIGQLAAGVAHEINTPLQVIKGYTEHLTMFGTKQNIEQQSYYNALKNIDKMNLRISTITNSLLFFSRDDSHQDFKKIPFKKILEHVSTVSPFYTNKYRIPITFDFSDFTDDDNLWCQETQICQVILNLIINSVDAIAKSSERWIKVYGQKSQTQIYIYIVDSGKGIAKEIVERIKEPFYTTKEIGKGTGLGLSISDGIMKSHSGSLDYVDGCDNTTFRLTFEKNWAP